MAKSIIFYMPKDPNNHTIWNGDTIRTGGIGVSGSHLSTVIAAEALANQPGFEVYLHNYCLDEIINKVNYVSQVRAKTYDYLVVYPWATEHTYEHVDCKNIIVWLHCPTCCGSLLNYLYKTSKPIYTVHLAEWCKGLSMLAMPDVIASKLLKHYVVPNGLLDPLPVINSSIHPPNSMFIASFERGGKVAQQVWSLLKERDNDRWGDFIVKAYTDKREQVDKVTIYKLFENIRYFIYPLVLPNDSHLGTVVHRDTFGCCVAEAIACGVEVFSYPVGALPEHYGDMVHWLPFPDGITANHINEDVHTQKQLPAMASAEQIQRIAAFVDKLDATYHDRASQRLDNARRVRERFSSKRIGNMWVEMLCAPRRKIL